MSPGTKRLCSCFATLVWAAVLLYFAVSGRIDAYLAPVFRHYALAGGIGLAILSLFILFTHRQASHCGHDHAPGETHDHDSSDLPPWVILLLMAGIASAAAFTTKDVFSPQALAHKAAMGGGAKALIALPAGAVPSREQIVSQRPRSADGSIQLELLELFSAANDAEYAANLEALEVEVQGRVSQGYGDQPEPFLYRLLLSCCAADGQPLPLTLRNLRANTFTNNHWVTVKGSMHFEKAANGTMKPVLKVSSLTESAPPREESLLRY